MKQDDVDRIAAGASAHDPSSSTVVRALGLLDVLVAHPRGLGLSALAQRAGLHKATAYRLVSALRAGGLVVQDTQSGVYRPGLKIVRMAQQLVESFDFRTLARPVVEALARDLGLGVFTGVLEGSDVVYLDRVEGVEVVQVATGVGTRRPVHLSAIGKAILAWLPDHAVDTALASCRFEARTEHSITSRADLLRQVELVRRRGWAEARDEDALGASSIAAPVFDHAGTVAGAIGIAGSSFTLRDARQEEALRQLLRATDQVSRSLGATQPLPSGETAP